VKPAATSVAFAPFSSQSKAEPVARLFRGLSEGDIAEIMAAGVMRRFAAGQIIAHADDPGTHLFLIKTGVVDYYRLTSQGKRVLIVQLFPGDHFVLVTMLDKPVGYMGTAVRLSTCISLLEPFLCFTRHGSARWCGCNEVAYPW
jgi:CRP-like cAMP-binding protein